MTDAPRPHLVHFVHADNGRAIATIARVLAAEMARLGHRVTLVAGTRSDPSPIPAGVDSVVLGGSADRTVTAIPKLRATLRRLAPGIAFAHGNGPNRALAVATTSMGRAPVAVGVEHNHYSSYAWSAPKLRLQLNRLLLPRLDLMIGVSDGVAEDLIETFPAVGAKVRMVPEPLTRFDEIPSMAAAPVPHPWLDDAVPVVTTVGHVHPRKDHRTLVRAIAHVHAVRGPGSLRLLVVGSAAGPEAHEVRRLARELGVDDSVELVGAQENPIAYVARSAVFAFSSRNEGLGIALLEAMAVGTPVVSTDCPSGPSFVLGEGAHGLLVPVGDDQALGDAIVRLLEDADLRRRLSAGGPARAARFAPATIAAEYLAAVGLGEPPH